MGIEPTWPAWKAGVLPLNYTRILSFALCTSREVVPQRKAGLTAPLTLHCIAT